MRPDDRDTLQFDFDLTLAIVLRNSDGTVYHRYGERSSEDPLSWMSMPSLPSRVARGPIRDRGLYC